MSETAEEYRAKRQALAIEALATGQTALASGDLSLAARWLDRARRISGGNDTIELLLASIRMRQGDPEAVAGFSELADRHDLFEAWLGLANAQYRRGETREAAAALGKLFSRHVALLPATLRQFANQLTTAAGAPGWCALEPDQVLVISPPTLPVTLTLDGRRLAAWPGRLPDSARRLQVQATGRDLLGSPLELDRMARLDGFVEATQAGVAGWAWHPNNPARAPALRMVDPRNRTSKLKLDQTIAETPQVTDRHDRPLSQPRRFAITQTELPGEGPFRIIGSNGKELPGSPVDPLSEQRLGRAVAQALAGRPADARVLALAPVPAALVGLTFVPRRAAVPPETVVVIPVYRGLNVTLACLDSALANSDGARIVVVDDAGPEPTLSAALDALSAAGRISLIRHARNLGFPAAANTGMRAAGRADVVLLNSDTLLPPAWLSRLREAAYTAPDIGSVTPLSNDATILSYPSRTEANPVPDTATALLLDRMADRANRGRTVDIPTAIGFCMFIRRDCLDQVGLLREDVFAQGYGEENDFCLRARHLGFRHLAATGIFVAHVGSQSFGAARTQLLTRNLAVLNRLHPGYDALIAADEPGPALALARRRIDLALLSRQRNRLASVIIVTHDLGGGVQSQVDVRCAAIRAIGQVPIVLRPVLARPLLQGTGEVTVDIGRSLSNLVYHVGREMPALARLLASQRPTAIEFHHMLGHDHALMQLPALLGLRYDMHVHDYACFCPRIQLVGFERRYCGEPDIAGCEACIADTGRNIDEDIAVAALVARSATDLQGARNVIVPSVDVAARLQRHFPGIVTSLRSWDDIRPGIGGRALRPNGVRTIGVLGAIGIEKGYDVLLACARDVAARALALRFVVIGHTTDDARLLRTGAVFITGEYRPNELEGLIEKESIDLAFLPSVWPETWCFTLSEAWKAGLSVVAFDIGAPAERIRLHGGGLLLPLGCRAAQINTSLRDAKLS